MSVRILVAEDDSFSQLVIHDMLKIIYPQAEIVIVGDGAEALDRLRNERFALVLSDVDMPVMDGNELVRSAKQDLGLEIPVISITALAVVGDRERLLMRGFDDYVSKPIDLEELRGTLDKYLCTKAV